MPSDILHSHCGKKVVRLIHFDLFFFSVRSKKNKNNESEYDDGFCHVRRWFASRRSLDENECRSVVRVKMKSLRKRTVNPLIHLVCYPRRFHGDRMFSFCSTWPLFDRELFYFSSRRFGRDGCVQLLRVRQSPDLIQTTNTSVLFIGPYLEMSIWCSDWYKWKHDWYNSLCRIRVVKHHSVHLTSNSLTIL